MFTVTVVSLYEYSKKKLRNFRSKYRPRSTETGEFDWGFHNFLSINQIDENIVLIHSSYNL